MRYEVQWDYVSGTAGPYRKGDVIDANDVDVAWLLRDSPGVLVPVEKPKQRRQAAAHDRMARPAQNRQEPITKADFKAVKDK